MSLAERLTEPQANKGGRPCTLCQALDRMDPADRDAVQDAIHTPGASDPWVAEQLQAEGYDIRHTVVGNHRRSRHLL